MTLVTEHQSAWMSKITNDDLTPSGTGCFIDCTHMAKVCIKGLTFQQKNLGFTLIRDMKQKGNIVQLSI